jgi:nucleoside-diphosphate-sugar epimerase
MRVFITGGSGFIGSAVIPELMKAGHQVLGLARSDASAKALAVAGVEVLRGELNDVDVLRAGATKSEGVIHLGYNHDFSRMEDAARTDLRAIETFGAVLENTNRPLVVAAGTIGIAPGRLLTERDEPDPKHVAHPRMASVTATQALAKRGVRTSLARFSPTVHGEGDHGFVARLVEIAREKGVSAYIGDGANRWPGVHRLDAAQLCRLALEKAPPGSNLHAVADEGVAIRDVATVIGKHLKLPVVSITPEKAADHFGWLGRFLAFDSPASNALTRELLGWQPTHPGLLADLDQGHYFTK